MPEYNCECCNFKTLRKSNYNEHLLSKKHLTNKPNVEPVKQEVVEPNVEIELLKTELFKMKTAYLESQSIKACIPVVVEEVKAVDTSFNLVNYLNVECKDAPNFEEIFTPEYLYDNNKWIMWVEISGTETPLFKNIHYFGYPKSNDFLVDYFITQFNFLERNKKPIFCSDVKRNVYHMKVENEWISVDINELCRKIYWKLHTFLFKSCYNVCHLSDFVFEKIYKKSKKTFAYEHLTPVVHNFDQTTFTKILTSKLPKFCNKNTTEYYIECKPDNWEYMKNLEKDNYVKNESESDEDC